MQRRASAKMEQVSNIEGMPVPGAAGNSGMEAEEKQQRYKEVSSTMRRQRPPVPHGNAARPVPTRYVV